MELSIRRLMRAPLFVASIVGTLAIGLGAFGVVSAVVYKVLIAPLPYDKPDDLYFVWRDYRAFLDLDRGWLAGTDVAELQKAGGVIEGAAVLRRMQPTLTMGTSVDPMEVSVMMTSPNLFKLLGVRPELGRTFAENDAGPGRPPLIVLTHGLWQQLGGGRDLLNKEVRLNDQPFTVIGVMPKSFGFVRNATLGRSQAADAYTAIDVNLAEASPGAGMYSGLIRARAGSTPEAVTMAVARVGKKIDERDFQNRGVKLYPLGLKNDLVAGVRPALVVLGLAGVFLVLVLMVNLATLLLARATQREKEFAVSRALGANQIAVIRATLFEGGILGIAGGVFGAVLAVWGTKVLVQLAPADMPRREFIAMDWKVGALVIGVGALLGLLAATLPATWGARTSLASLLSNAAVRGGGGQGRMRRGMVVVQVALSLVLLSTGGLVVRSFDRLLRADPGFNPDGVLTARIPISEQRYPEAAGAQALVDRMHSALAALPGVERVSATSSLPLTAEADQTTIRVPNAPGNTGDRDHDGPLVDYMGVRAGYFEAMGMRIIAGRGFETTRRAGVREVVVDHTFAEYFFPTGNPIGAVIPFGESDTLTIVGVTQQARMYDVHKDDRLQVYIRAEDWEYATLSWVIRSDRSPSALAPEVRSAIHRVDPQLALADVKSMENVLAESLSQQRVSAVLVGGFALGALLLAAMGLFGVVSTTVSRRRHELAVRLAIGANHGEVMRRVLGDGAMLVGLGLLIGVPGTYFSGKAISSALVGVSPYDPVTLTAVALGLAAVALLACYLPARRVLGIHPAQSLRNESA